MKLKKNQQKVPGGPVGITNTDRHLSNIDGLEQDNRNNTILTLSRYHKILFL